jgi:Skp family chaperone for outer membrane proteins
VLALASLALVAAPVAAEAQTANPITGGPTIAGLCLLSQTAVFVSSKVGQAATARLRQLAQAEESGFSGERQAIETEAKTLQDQKSALSPSQLRTRQDALAQRAQAYQDRVQMLSRQIEATRIKAVGQIAQAAQPVVAQAYQARGCGLLFSRDAVLAGNMANDLTPAVVQGLDAKMTTITFDLEPASAVQNGSPSPQ